MLNIQQMCNKHLLNRSKRLLTFFFSAPLFLFQGNPPAFSWFPTTLQSGFLASALNHCRIPSKCTEKVQNSPGEVWSADLAALLRSSPGRVGGRHGLGKGAALYRDPGSEGLSTGHYPGATSIINSILPPQKYLKMSLNGQDPVKTVTTIPLTPSKELAIIPISSQCSNVPNYLINLIQCIHSNQQLNYDPYKCSVNKCLNSPKSLLNYSRQVFGG